MLPSIPTRLWCSSKVCFPTTQHLCVCLSNNSRVKIVNVPFHGVNQFTLDAVPVYEKKLEESNASGTPIRALLICNPHNPLGQCYPPEVLEAYMQLCAEHKLHLIVDEVYALSCYKQPPNPAILNRSNQSEIETKIEPLSSSDIT